MNEIDQNNTISAINSGFVPKADGEIKVNDDLMANTQSILQKARAAQQLFLDEQEVAMMEGKEWVNPDTQELVIGDMVIPPLTPDQAPYKTVYEPVHGHDFKGAVVQKNGKNYKSVKTENPLYVHPEERADLIRTARAKLEADKKKLAAAVETEGFTEIDRMVMVDVPEATTSRPLSLSQVTADIENKLQGYEILSCERQGKQLKIQVNIL